MFWDISQACHSSGSLLLAPCHDLKYAAFIHMTCLPKLPGASKCCKWSKFKCLIRLVVILFVFPLRKVEKRQGKLMVWLGNGACASVSASCTVSAFRAKYCCHLVKWYFTYLIRIHTSNIKYRALFKTTSVSNYCRSVCSNFWSICGNVEWDIMFPQGWTEGFVKRKAVWKFIPRLWNKSSKKFRHSS